MDRNENPSPKTFPSPGDAHAPARGVSRRQMFGTAGALSAAVMAGLPVRALATKPGSGAPNPIPHITGPGLHFFFPGPADGAAVPTDPTGAHPDGREPSTIFDFNGFIGVADLNLTGTGTNTTTGETALYGFHTDMRFMKGVFVDTEGRNHRGSFAFI